jgi:hypothetical protein
MIEEDIIDEEPPPKVDEINIDDEVQHSNYSKNLVA